MNCKKFVSCTHPLEKMVNRWGHIMLKLCFKDDVIVISYRSHVDTYNISTRLGFMGGYELRPFAFELKKSLVEYTTNEN